MRMLLGVKLNYLLRKGSKKKRGNAERRADWTLIILLTKPVLASFNYLVCLKQREFNC